MGGKILVGAVINAMSYFPTQKTFNEAHSWSGINFGFPSAASGRLFMACSVHLLILCPWQSVPCPRPVGARGSAC